MKKIVVSAIIVTMVTVGTYLVALAIGASEPAAFAFAVVVAVVVDAVATAAVVAASAAFVATFVAVVVASSTTTAAVAVAAFVVAVVAALAVVAVAVAAEREGIRFRWAFAAYALEAVTVGGALMVGSVGWSIAIALAGVVALLVLWRFAPKPSHAEQVADAPSATAISEHNGA